MSSSSRSSSFFVTSSEPPSTAPSTPPPVEPMGTDDGEVTDISEDRLARLNDLLERSAFYSDFLKNGIDQEKARHEAEVEKQRVETPVKRGEKTRRNTRKGTKRTVEDVDDAIDCSTKRRKLASTNHEPVEEKEDGPVFPQPKLVTGAKMKNYQLEGLQWMVCLHKNGMAGILADEMGLGKTLQTIAFSAHLREQRFSRPFLIVCPLSVLHNWVSEYEKFTPTIPVCKYHGNPEERAEMRRTLFAAFPKKPVESSSVKAAMSKAKPKGKGRGGRGRPQRGKGLVGSVEDEEIVLPVPRDSHTNDEDDEETIKKVAAMPVVITTYEMIMKDRIFLAAYDWGYIVVDEGHRLRNLDCKLVREIKEYSAEGRMILTGTPLHNNLSELWALMSFVLPDIFDEPAAFEDLFNLPTLQQSLGSTRSTAIINALHGILKPFMLRRLKADVETLPEKKEYVLYAPLSGLQRDIYNEVLKGTLRSYLIGTDASLPKKAESIENGPRKLRSQTSKRGRKSYLVDGDDDEYFEMLEKGELDERGVRDLEERPDLHSLNREHKLKSTVKKVNNMKLQNTVMQLRKICSHPFLFDWPLDRKTGQPAVDEQLVDLSGKMRILNRLLPELFRRKHKVLLFSQFKTTLDIIEDWAREMMGWDLCRIDGQTSAIERVEEMERFQTGDDSSDAPMLFLLSTRAGGLGLNLVAADTVIFYDQDWNPQMDAQAQDRAHRIGQTKPVLVFRLISRDTIETRIMERASQKRQLEAVVIAKGKFKSPATAANEQSTNAMTLSLLHLEAEKVDVASRSDDSAEVLSDKDLEVLLDRRQEVFTKRGLGWTSAAEVARPEAAFAVYQAPINEGSNSLAEILDGSDI